MPDGSADGNPDNSGRRQERVWRAQRPGAKIYAIATLAGGRDRTPGIRVRKEGHQIDASPGLLRTREMVAVVDANSAAFRGLLDTAPTTPVGLAAYLDFIVAESDASSPR